ncbi:hypothetical protein GAYE_SCF07G2889 [Galdieria yellowstonensis]|uniref:Protein kinase domain-containing protein n=1 Tax=Galdieria yellowstonensis TaxID=3028027 RepID=A0AAV9IC00_9RHOD|nr:hypothetical protein GAYE_SCF07G2889 [Galdieria yellowstonensis]
MANDSEELTKLFDQYINTYKESGWCIDQQNLQIIRVLGNGASGTTYEGKYRDIKVAVKAYSAKILKEDFFYGICFMTNPFAACLVTELAPNGELGKALYPKSGINIFSKLGQDIKFKIAIGVARGLQYLHSNKIVHRDVKPANVLLDEHHEPKLTDFGFSRLVDYSGKMTGETGSYKYMAPEVMRHQKYSESADIYSFAVVINEMFCEEPPYRYLLPVQAAIAVAKKGARPSTKKLKNDILKNIIERCWSENPAERPDWETIIKSLQHAETYQKRPTSVFEMFKKK